MFSKIALGLITLIVGAMGYTYISSHYDINEKSGLNLERKILKSTMYETTEGTRLEVVENLDGYKIIINDQGQMQILFHIESDHMLKQELGY